MTLLNNLFALSDGIIFEPSEPDNIGYWEFLFSGQHQFPFYLALAVAAVCLITGIILSIIWKEFDHFIMFGPGTVAFIGIALLGSQLELHDQRVTFTGYEVDVVAEQLSEHYNTKVTADDVLDSGLIDALVDGKTVSQLEYSSDMSRDAKTGEWAKSINYFIVDGRVVEIYSESEPLQGEFKASKSETAPK